MNQSLIASLKCSVMDKVLLSIWQTSIFVSDCHFFVSWNWRRSFCRDYVFHLDNKCVFICWRYTCRETFLWFTGHVRHVLMVWQWNTLHWVLISHWILLGSKHLHRSNILFDSFNLSHLYLYSGLKLRLICFEYNKYNIFN